MIELTPTRFKFPPASHQLRGIRALVEKPNYGLFWEPRLRKSSTVINAACFLFEAGVIDTVVVVCPAQVKAVWRDKELGEIQKHCFVPVAVLDYKGSHEGWLGPEGYWLTFIVTSYEFLRQEDAQGRFPKVELLKKALENRKAWLVCDESSALGNRNALQTRAVLELRKSCQRATLLTGTPVGNSPLELYSQFQVLDERILRLPNYWAFRNKYTVRGGFKGREVVGYRNLEDLTARTRDHCEYLEQRDCPELDLREPESTFLTVPLSKGTWRVYCQLRDELVARLDSGELEVTNAAVAALRLAQVCTGFVGGVDDEVTGEKKVIELSDETLKAFSAWLEEQLEREPDFKCVVWCRFRSELERLVKREACEAYVYGGKKMNLDWLHPDSNYQGPLVCAAQPQAGGFGLNLSRASTNVFLSRDYNRINNRQAEERIKAPGHPVFSVDFLATGPDGERTVAWDVRKSLESKDDVAKRTVKDWKKVLMEA
jgi:hypothetical protein